MTIEKTIGSKYKWIFLVKSLVLLTCGGLIYQKLIDPKRFGEEFTELILGAIDPSAILVLIGVFFLMPINWLLEAMKWKLLVHPYGRISIREAFRGVLSGLSLSFVTPHGLGDYAGRLLSLEGTSKGQLVGSVWLGRAMQMLTTGLFGMVGVWMFVQMSSIEISPISPWWWGFLISGLLVAILLYRSSIKVFGKRLRYYFMMIRAYRWQDYLRLFILSTGRYVTFSIQYLLILYVFEVPLPVLTLFGGISWMFLMKSIIPSFNFLSDLGVRELSAITFFDLYHVSQPAILTSSLLLWVINILFPVLIGLYFVIKLKIISKQ